MDKTIENASDIEVHEDDIIELGAASTTTLGGGAFPGEVMGQNTPIGISEE